ncbi:hypothetical protein A0U40_17600 [[Bacillus] sp. KCTC 13219]|nr:hypothetical protein A0U40_17600 [[Bacillus] sp. KCTC 13219]
MLKDRGLKKWQGMMMTEHVEMIKEMNLEVTLEKSRTLSDWELENLQQVINQAMQQKLEVKLEVWEGNGHVPLNGIIKAINRNILILETDTITKSIPLSDILDAELEEYFD